MKIWFKLGTVSFIGYIDDLHRKTILAVSYLSLTGNFKRYDPFVTAELVSYRLKLFRDYFRLS